MNKINRRNFIGAAAVAALYVGTSKGSSPESSFNQETVRVRPNIADLDPNGIEIAAYRRAVSVMKSRPSSDPRSWFAQARIHQQFCSHANWFFLPWHRAYLYYFEDLCREFSGMADFMLPYWDWSTSPFVPAVFWNSSDPLWNARNIRPNETVSIELTNLTRIDQISRIPDFQTFASGASAAQQQSSSYGELEGTPHNHVHSRIGGDMGSYLSPLDPVFWLHHANVDRIWTMWQQNFPNGHPNAPTWLEMPMRQFVDRTGAQRTPKVSDLLSTYKLGYRYANQPPTPIAELFLGQTVKVGESQLSTFKTLDVTSTSNKISGLTLDLPEKLQGKLKQSSDLSITTIKTLKASEVRIAQHRLTIEIDKPQDPSQLVRVFINCANPGTETPIGDPTYAGTIAFFENHHHSQPSDGNDSGGVLRFSLDVSDTIVRLARAGLYSSQSSLNVALVPVPADPAKTEEKTIVLKKVTLDILE